MSLIADVASVLDSMVMEYVPSNKWNKLKTFIIMDGLFCSIFSLCTYIPIRQRDIYWYFIFNFFRFQQS